MLFYPAILRQVSIALPRREEGDLRRLRPPAQLQYSAAGGHSRGFRFPQWFANPTAMETGHARCQTSPVSSLLIAIDISKHRHEVLMAVPGKARRGLLTIRNHFEDFERLVVGPAMACRFGSVSRQRAIFIGARHSWFRTEAGFPRLLWLGPAKPFTRAGTRTTEGRPGHSADQTRSSRPFLLLVCLGHQRFSSRSAGIAKTPSCFGSE